MPNTIQDQRYVEVISRFRTIRKRNGLSQKELAAKLGKLQSYVSKYETFERRLDLLEAIDLCQTLGVTLNEVIPLEYKYLIK